MKKGNKGHKGNKSEKGSQSEKSQTRSNPSNSYNPYDPCNSPMSWSSIKTQGIVLRVHPAAEADRRYSILTPDHGKLDVLGRGAQKGLAKLASHLEPFAIVNLEVIRGRRSTTVISVDRDQTFHLISQSLERRLLTSALLHVLDRYTREHDPDPDLYDFCRSWLTFLNREEPLKSTRSTFLLGAFLLRLMQQLGYETQLSDCVNCKEEILPLSFRWHAGKGGLVCSDCVQKEKEEWFTARSMDEETVKLLRFAREAGLESLLAPALSGTQVEAFCRVVHDLEAFHLPGDFDTPFWSGVLAGYELELPRELG